MNYINRLFGRTQATYRVAPTIAAPAEQPPAQQALPVIAPPVVIASVVATPSPRETTKYSEIKLKLDNGLTRARVCRRDNLKIEAERLYRDLIALCDDTLQTADLTDDRRDAIKLYQRDSTYELGEVLESRDKPNEALPYYKFALTLNHPSASRAVDKLEYAKSQPAPSVASTSLTELDRQRRHLTEKVIKQQRPDLTIPIETPELDSVQEVASDSRSGVGLLLSHIREAQPVINGIKDERLVLLVGKTGAGKSTVGNYLLGATLRQVFAKEVGAKGSPRAVVDESSPTSGAFAIGHGKVSYTSVPKAVKSESGYSFCDCPGFKDSRGPEQNIANGVVLQRMIKAGKSVRFVLVLDYWAIRGDRGEGIKSSLQTILDLLGGESELKKHAGSLIVVINKAPDRYSTQDIIEEYKDCHPLLQALASPTLVLDFMGTGDAERSNRRDILDALNQLDDLADTPVYTVLNAKDERYLRDLVGQASKEIDDAIRAGSYGRINEILTVLSQLNQLGHGYIDRSLATVQARLYTSIQAKVDQIRELCDRGDYDAAESVLHALTQASEHLAKQGGQLGQLPNQVSAGRRIIDRTLEMIREKAALKQQLADQAAQSNRLVKELDKLRVDGEIKAQEAKAAFQKELALVKVSLESAAQEEQEKLRSTLAELQEREALQEQKREIEKQSFAEALATALEKATQVERDSEKQRLEFESEMKRVKSEILAAKQEEKWALQDEMEKLQAAAAEQRRKQEEEKQRLNAALASVKTASQKAAEESEKKQAALIKEMVAVKARTDTTGEKPTVSAGPPPKPAQSKPAHSVTAKQKKWLDEIEKNSQNIKAYRNLEETLEEEESITLLNGECVSKVELMKKIKTLFNHLLVVLKKVSTMKTGEIAIMPNGERMSEQALYLKAIALDGESKKYYTNLATTLKSGEVITLPNGERMSQQALYLKAIALDGEFASAYNGLGNTLKSGEVITLPNGERMSKQDLYLKTIALDGECASAYNSLGVTLKAEEVITLPNGERMSEQALYLKAIALNGEYASAYNNLGLTLKSGEVITLPNGERMSKQALYLKAIALDGENAFHYVNLANTLKAGKVITLPNGERMSQQALYLKAIALDEKPAVYYSNLANTLKAGEVITLPNGERMSQQELYLKAIGLDGEYALAYNNLAITLKSGEVITLPNGERMSQQALYLKAIVLDGKLAHAYNGLGNTLKPGEVITLPNGECMSKQALYLKAIALDGEYGFAYNLLGDTLKAGESITLLNGQRMSQQALYLKALDCDDAHTNKYVYNDLANTLADGEGIRLLDRRYMTKTELMAEHKRYNA